MRERRRFGFGCISGTHHGAIITADDDPEIYDPSVMGPVPNGHQYGYCEKCEDPFRWSVPHQRWLLLINWPDTDDVELPLDDIEV